jgi:hypothetical protein
MSISNYAELQTAVANWLHRSDMTAQIPDFISLGEAKLNRTLRLRAMENVATGSTGTSVSLPTGFLEVRALTVSDGSATWPLTYTEPSNITTDTSAPTQYSIVGDSIYFLGTSSSFTYTLTYYKKFDALSAGVNWLITNAPDTYLYSALLEAAPFIKDDARSGIWAELLKASIQIITQADTSDRYGSNLVVRVA